MMTINPVASLYPLIAAFGADFLSLLSKPVFYGIRYQKWKPELIHSSGGFPSSHSALVAALATSIGIQDHFSSTAFALSCVFACIVIYDAANVRYYSGQNIRITRKLVRDLEERNGTEFSDPLYRTPMKEVLGHTWPECIAGILFGITFAILVGLIFH